MSLRDAAQQALEALKTCDAAHPSDGGRQWYDDKAVEEAITALEAALAEPQPEPVAWTPLDDYRENNIKRCEAKVKRLEAERDAARAALAWALRQPFRYPVIVPAVHEAAIDAAKEEK